MLRQPPGALGSTHGLRDQEALAPREVGDSPRAGKLVGSPWWHARPRYTRRAPWLLVIARTRSSPTGSLPPCRRTPGRGGEAGTPPPRCGARAHRMRDPLPQGHPRFTPQQVGTGVRRSRDGDYQVPSALSRDGRPRSGGKGVQRAALPRAPQSSPLRHPRS